ncbi:MAG: 3-methyl-2-oxobutanoate hydroxymethyltransferase [Azospirillaceae bacterium]
MKRIFDWGARPAMRKLTIADLRAARGQRQYVQVTANTAEEAAAAEAAGCDMIVCRSRGVEAIRQGSPHLFVTAALGFAERITDEELLREAFFALTHGADAVLIGRGMGVVQMLADEDIPVVGHVGMVPRKSTWVGGVRAVGKTAAEALDLHRRFRRLEEAGAFAVEAELIVEPVMAELTARTGLVTISLGSGRHADVIFQFMSDVCGEEERSPRHARTYGRIATLRQQIREERVRALTAFCRDVERRDYPGQAETVAGSQEELDRFKQLLDRETA